MRVGPLCGSWTTHGRVAEDLPDVELTDHNRMGETVAYRTPKLRRIQGLRDPSGSSDMSRSANYTPQVHGRYTFGSGAQPLAGYTIKRAIGRGGFGEVYYATSDFGNEVGSQADPAQSRCRKCRG